LKDFTELTTAQPLVKRLLEADVQSACVAYARSKGFWARKFSSPANRSVPDYLFAKHPVKLAVEFKAPGKSSTKAQTEEQGLMMDAGWTMWVDVGREGQADIDWFKRQLDAL